MDGDILQDIGRYNPNNNLQPIIMYQLYQLIFFHGEQYLYSK